MSNKLIDISQLLNTPDGTYVNGEVEGWIANYVPPFKQGAPAKAKLQEGAHVIDISLWGGDCSHWNGKRVKLSGKGMKVTEFKGTKQLSVGDKVSIEAAGGAKSVYAGETMPGDPPDRPAPPQAPSVAQNAPARLMEYSQLYAECIKHARHTVNDASFEDGPETIRQISTAFFIQAMKEGIKP